MNELLADSWHNREFPVLIEAARILNVGGSVRPVELAEAQGLELDPDLVELACEALVPTYLTAGRTPPRGGRSELVLTGLTDAGRRATGLWPNQESQADALVELLTQAADQAGDEDDAGALRKAGRLLRGVPASVLADVTAALIRQQAGLS